MARILVIDGHPDAASLTAQLAASYAAGAGDDTVALVLRDLDFDLTLRTGYRTPQDLEPDLARAQELLEWADHVAVFTPVWWGSVPALLKGFFDRTLERGWAFRYQENGMPEGLLVRSHRSARGHLGLTAVVPPPRRRHHRQAGARPDDGVLRHQADEGDEVRRRARAQRGPDRRVDPRRRRPRPGGREPPRPARRRTAPGPGQLSDSTASTAFATRSGSSCATQTMRGSLRNQPSWRRENRRVPVLVCSIASASVRSPARKPMTSR